MDTFRVQTEADPEGRRLRTLGYYKGNLCDIVKRLQDKVYYSLYITKITPKLVPKSNRPVKKVFVYGYDLDEEDTEDLIKCSQCKFNTNTNPMSFEFSGIDELSINVINDKAASIIKAGNASTLSEAVVQSVSDYPDIRGKLDKAGLNEESNIVDIMSFLSKILKEAE